MDFVRAEMCESLIEKKVSILLGLC
jgi:hypothetical protein